MPVLLRKRAGSPWIETDTAKSAPQGRSPVGIAMATTVERRTVTHQTRIEGASQVKANLAAVAAEIALVRDRAREEANSLERIRGMLDVSYLNNLVKTIEELEIRMSSFETVALNSASQVDQAQAELRQEQERLAKLWDAYKAQEDEFKALKAQSAEWAPRLGAYEREIDSLHREVSRLEPLSRMKAEFDNAQRENQVLRHEVESVNRELRAAHDEMARHVDELASLRALGNSKSRVTELEHELDTERDRLAKLYKVYEEQSAGLKASHAHLDRWEAWFSRMEPAMVSFCRGVSDAPRA